MVSLIEKNAMMKALEIARQGQRNTFPNPMVGAVILNKNGDEIASGYHARCGAPHAEIEALAKAGSAASGGTLVVTLEPCCHSGRTGPCTDEIIRAGIVRICIAMEDPNPSVSGGGIAQLRNAGIDVESGMFKEEAQKLNSLYLHYLKTGRSRLRLKMAVSLDGRIAAADETSGWITGEKARERVQHMRASASAILTGGGTIRKDNPLLTVRHNNMNAELQPVRIIVSVSGNLCLPRRIFGTQGKVIVAVPETLAEKKKTEIKETGAVLWEFKPDNDRINLRELLERTAGEGYGEIFCECGGTLASELLNAKLIDRLSIFTAPILLGSKGIPAFGDIGVYTMDDAFRLTQIRQKVCGEDVLVEGKVVYRVD